jgi:hypothetical protein
MTWDSTAGWDHSRCRIQSAKGYSGTQFWIELYETLEHLKRVYLVRSHHRCLVFETPHGNLHQPREFPEFLALASKAAVSSLHESGADPRRLVDFRDLTEALSKSNDA